MNDKLDAMIAAHAASIVLVAVNDGDGSQCLANYAQRCALARQEHGGTLLRWRQIAGQASKYIGRPPLSNVDRLRAITTASERLRAYYVEHVAEIDNPPA
jgi:hypothetical protein